MWKMKIEAGQRYRVIIDEWHISEIEPPLLARGDILTIVSVGIDRASVKLPDTHRYVAPRLLHPINADGSYQWMIYALKYHIEGEAPKLALVSESDSNVPTGSMPENNGKSEICHWCGRATEPMFGTLRICRKCGK
jgi:hypothetical protein